MNVAAHLLRKARWKPWELLVWPLAAALVFVLPEKALLMNEIAILALFALSLDLVLGYAGIVSLGHAAFLGVGAYAAGLLSKYGISDPLLCLACAIALAALLGFVTSFLLLRGTDLTRLMVTLGVSLICLELANRMAWLTGGADGLQGISMRPVLGLFDFDFLGRTAYLYSLSVLFLLFLLARLIVNAPFGMSLQAIKTNALRASAIGISPHQRLVAIYTIGAGFAGAAGALSAQTTAFVSLDIFDFHRSAGVLLMLILGGSGYLYGGLIGAIVLRIAQNWLSALTPQYWEFWIGFALVVIVWIGHARIVGFFRTLPASLLKRLARADKPA